MRPFRAFAAMGLAAVLTCTASADNFTFNFTLDGSQAVPPNDSDAVGAAQLIYDDVTQTFDFDLMVFGIGLDDLVNVGPNGTPIHIHNAPAGATGPIVVDLGFLSSFQEDGQGIRLQISDALFGGEQGNLNTDVDENESALFANELYVNIHTTSFGGGEIRGQIVPEPTTLAAMTLGGLVLARRRR